ncbi:MAG: hypothetical protein ACLRFF_03280 [Alphaproteobacteria bacterium]
MVITYVPVAGLTIKEALVRAIQKSKDNKCTVMAVLNDIVMFVNKNTNVNKVLEEYRQKLDLKYYTERVKRAR